MEHDAQARGYGTIVAAPAQYQSGQLGQTVGPVPEPPFFDSLGQRLGHCHEVLASIEQKLECIFPQGEKNAETRPSSTGQAQQAIDSAFLVLARLNKIDTQLAKLSG